jgi:predicted nucleic acid-binding protein
VILVDSSVWIGLLRNAPTRPVQILRTIAGQEPLLVGDLVMAEVLQAARDDTHAAIIERELRRFAVISITNDRLAVIAARNHRKLRAVGITVRKTIDLLIGTFCIEAGHALLHDDRDFEPMVAHLGLQAVG